MVQRIVTTYTDDLTGEESADVTTQSFALNGVEYEIDLGRETADDLEAALSQFIEAGRKVGKTKGAAGKKAAQGGPSTDVIREWARMQGMKVNSRGRIAAPIREAYEAAH
jgi:hypothetical protein